MEQNKLLSFIQQNKKPNEEFKEITGTEGRYYISNQGRVASGAWAIPHFMEQWIANNGYKKISIRRNGKRKNLYVHALVAEAFIEKPKSAETLVIHHLDFDKSNNNKENLVYMPIGEHTILHNKKRA